MFHTFANSEGMPDGTDDWYSRQWDITHNLQKKYEKNKIDNLEDLIALINEWPYAEPAIFQIYDYLEQLKGINPLDWKEFKEKNNIVNASLFWVYNNAKLIRDISKKYVSDSLKQKLRDIYSYIFDNIMKLDTMSEYNCRESLREFPIEGWSK